MKLTLASPCPLKFDQSPDKVDGKWLCSHCDRHVHDISGMTAAEASHFLRAQSVEDPACGEWYADKDGHVLFDVARAAVAAAALFVATTAHADGNREHSVGAVELLLLEASAEANQFQHQAVHGSQEHAGGDEPENGSPGDSDADVVLPEPPRIMYRGRMLSPSPVSHAPPNPSSPTPVSKTGP